MLRNRVPLVQVVERVQFLILHVGCVVIVVEHFTYFELTMTPDEFLDHISRNYHLHFPQKGHQKHENVLQEVPVSYEEAVESRVAEVLAHEVAVLEVVGLVQVLQASADEVDLSLLVGNVGFEREKGVFGASFEAFDVVEHLVQVFDENNVFPFYVL